MRRWEIEASVRITADADTAAEGAQKAGAVIRNLEAQGVEIYEMRVRQVEVEE